MGRWCEAEGAGEGLPGAVLCSTSPSAAPLPCGSLYRASCRRGILQVSFVFWPGDRASKQAVSLEDADTQPSPGLCRDGGAGGGRVRGVCRGETRSPALSSARCGGAEPGRWQNLLFCTLLPVSGRSVERLHFSRLGAACRKRLPAPSTAAPGFSVFRFYSTLKIKPQSLDPLGPMFSAILEGGQRLCLCVRGVKGCPGL